MAMSLRAASEFIGDTLRETVGVLMIGAGLLALVFPLVASVPIIKVVGWVLIASGVLQGIGLIGARQVPHFWLDLISVALSIIVGLLLLRDPGQGLRIMTVLLIVFFMVEGIAKVIFGLTIRPSSGWGWVFASGLVGIVLALYLFANLSVTSDWVEDFLLAILLISEGVALTYLSWRKRMRKEAG